MRRLILGTAGHIDHGKTALVQALTGVDTDRLAEEKRRGITIDLGFAELPVSDDLAFGVVDVPGHESFIRNMLAGATGMDLVLLVVSADEATMPQTREHLAIVRLLGVERVVVALSRIDLVEEEWLELALDDVRELLAGTPYADAPIVPTSAVTGAGLDELRAALAREGGRARARLDADIVRLPVDRVFTVRGTGTVVTGTLWSGSLSLDQRIRLEPGGLAARVRGLEVHGRSVRTARAGERTAVALAGSRVGREAVGRGQVVVGADPWVAADRVTARIELLPDTAWGIERGQRVRVHLGTSEVMARVFLLDCAEIVAGEVAWAQLRLEAPLVARTRDHVVLRSYSPMTTIGGGIVAEPSP
ncbi:MAG: selenocysteine-specific translation elongation factor, partial [Gemmatimonadetes bacterium]|nr:selenocysteine-specific translation elongation factor [Gemmatimonadota bacterium]